MTCFSQGYRIALDKVARLNPNDYPEAVSIAVDALETCPGRKAPATRNGATHVLPGLKF